MGSGPEGFPAKVLHQGMSRMAPVSPLPGIHTLVKSHSFEYGRDLVTYFLLLECSRSDGCPSEINLCWAVSSILHTLFFSHSD